MPLRPFSICIADPAWSYNQKGTRGCADNHYKTMPTAELMRLGPLVSDVMADDAILLVWGTWPLLQECLDFVAACGFTYKSCGGVWLKTNKSGKGFFFGTGFYVRGNSEFVLLGTRGRPKPVNRSVRQVMVNPVTEHSRKPTTLHRNAEKLMGDVPRLELFARRLSPGWTCLGNEIDGQDLTDSLPHLAGLINLADACEGGE